MLVLRRRQGLPDQPGSVSRHLLQHPGRGNQSLPETDGAPASIVLTAMLMGKVKRRILSMGVNTEVVK